MPFHRVFRAWRRRCRPKATSSGGNGAILVRVRERVKARLQLRMPMFGPARTKSARSTTRRAGCRDPGAARAVLPGAIPACWEVDDEVVQSGVSEAPNYRPAHRMPTEAFRRRDSVDRVAHRRGAVWQSAAKCYTRAPARVLRPPSGRGAAWLARVLWEHEVASSNLAAPTTTNAGMGTGWPIGRLVLFCGGMGRGNRRATPPSSTILGSPSP